MPLFTPALGLVMLFTNVFDTYKVLKRPPPSQRDAGRPTVRALTQRKRAMKGCLAVWIVWCCFVSYERWAERIVSIFIPFYQEIKMIFMLFLMLTKAGSAEPIYLHIIRPLLKPYAPILDPLFDVACGLGDFALSPCLWPIYSLISWWRYAFYGSQADLASDEENRELESSVEQPPKSHHRSLSQPAQPSGKRPPTTRQVSAASSVPVPRPQSSRRTGASQPAAQVESQEMWQPPPPYDSSPEEEAATLSQRPDGFGQTSSFDELPARSPGADEWRKYPAFPSAYPTTPLPPPNIVLTSASQQLSPSLATITEGAPAQAARLGLPPRAPLNLGFASGSSDDDSLGRPGNLDDNQPSYSPASGDTEEQDEDEEAEGSDEDDDAQSDSGEEDEFNVTLGTPIKAPYGSLKTRVAAHSARESVDSLDFGAGKPGMSRNSSASSSSLPVHDALNKKRAQPANSQDSLPGKTSGTSKPSSQAQATRRRTALNPSANLMSKSQPNLPPASAIDEDGSGSESDPEAAALHDDKRRKVYGTVGRATASSRAAAANAPKRVVSTSQLQTGRQTKVPVKPKGTVLSGSAPAPRNPRLARTTSDNSAPKKA